MSVAPLRIGLDLDGCFADFNTAFARQLALTTGRRLVLQTEQPYLPPVWAWPTAIGYTREEQELTWQDVERNPAWWLRLEPYAGAGAALRLLNTWVAGQRVQIHFLTSRPGANAHWQSVQWLAEQGLQHPQVLVARHAGDKAELATRLELRLLVDDHTANLAAVEAGGTTEPVCFDRPWNKTAPGIRIATYADLLELLQAWPDPPL
jgi:hypothetical protein